MSIPYEELNLHINTMLNLSCHLIWIDCIKINKINFFSLLWIHNDESGKIRSAKPPSYMIFYDLNTAQLAHIYKEYCLDNNWNLEIIESYVKTTRPSNIRQNKDNRRAKSARRFNQIDKTSSQQNSPSKSYEEIYYICQFKLCESNSKSAKKLNNKLQHSIIDLKYDEWYNQVVSSKKYIPFNINQILVNVNTINNKHYYFTTLYKPIDYFQLSDDDIETYQKNSDDLKNTSLYIIKNNLNDTDLYKLWEDFSKKNWKIIDLKAYKDENLITKFSAIWSPLPKFYEGSYKLFIGLNKNELISKVNEMNSKGLYPRFLANYGYTNSSNELVY